MSVLRKPLLQGRLWICMLTVPGSPVEAGQWREELMTITNSASDLTARSQRDVSAELPGDAFPFQPHLLLALPAGHTSDFQGLSEAP